MRHTIHGPGTPLIPLDFVGTLAAAGLALFAGYGLQRRVRPLARYNIPAPVIGGLLVALAVTLLRAWGRQPLSFDTTLQPPLMIAFFTSIGFGASVPLLRSGGPGVALFLGLATVVAVLQNVAGALVAAGLGVPPLLGVLAGSVTLTGGPATGLAFAPLFEQAGVKGAATLAVAAAMVGIVSGGIIGGPIGTFLIERRRLRPSAGRPGEAAPTDAATAADTVLALESPDPVPAALAGEDPGARALLKGAVSLLVAMAVGSWVGAGFTALGVTLPAYIGAMLVAAALRNLDDVTDWIGLPHRLLDDLGNAALALFIAMALMTLRLWEIASLALPLAAILAVQVVLVALVCFWPTFRLMGRDYDAAVMSSGFCGFMLGTTANAMANMGVLADRYGPAPRAYLVVPMVGAFFIDFTNAVIITAFLNFWR
jgi:glutamate:Na+ symporter, ESS family